MAIFRRHRRNGHPWYGGYSVVTGVISAGSLIAFLIYAINLSNPVKRLSQVYGNIQKAMAAGDRVFAILDTEPTVKENRMLNRCRK